MTVIIHPQPGTIVRVDLTEGFRPPEMVKRRPCVILSPPLPGRQQLCSIVPLSTTEPNRIERYHTVLEFDPPLPAPYESPRMWLKGDIVLTVAFHRLRFLFLPGRGQRQYDIRVLDPEAFVRVQQCVKAGLGLGG
jgi:mRNA interferase MazF